MMPPSSSSLRKGRARRRTAVIAAVGVAIAAHGTALGVADAYGILWTGPQSRPRAEVAKAEQVFVDLQTTCRGDVLLATSARIAMCSSPTSTAAFELCVDEAVSYMWMDLSACDSRLDPIAVAPIEIMQPKQVAAVTPIEPEALLEELMREQKQQPPPPPPPPQPQQQQPPPPPPPPPQQRPTQIVENVKTDDKEPENARFLAEHNTKVEKQTVARGARNEPMVAKSKPEELTPKKEPPKDDPSIQKRENRDPGREQKAPDAPGKLSMRKPGAQNPSEAPQDAKTRGQRGNKAPLVAGGFLPRQGDGAVEQSRKDPGKQTTGQGGAGGGSPQTPDLKPKKETLERIAGGGSVDHLEEVKDGDETALNAKRWVYASFFNRMKRQVAQNWDPQSVWRRSDPNGTHHGFKTRVTEVRVSLSGKGHLNKIVVTAPSGVAELDEEAVRAFHAAAPFPNPPDGLVQKDGQITFAFSFYFEIGAPRTSWRVIRQ